MKKVLILTQDPLVSLRQTVGGNGISDDGKCRFYINDIDSSPDFIVVKGKGISSAKQFQLPKNRTMLVTCEPYGIVEYPRGYCEQFGTVLACQPDLKVSPGSGTRVIYTPAVLPWFVGGIFENGGCRITRNREEILLSEPKKEKFMSVVTSKKAFTKGHVDRLRFIRKLKDRFGDKVDIFGGGFKRFDDKWDAIAPYKYHIVIENSECDYYWTEKLSDCYLAGAYPLYHGCTNVKEYFPESSFTPIDICDFDSVAEIINKIDKEGTYEKNLDAVNEAKLRVVGEHNMFNIIARAVSEIEMDNLEGTTEIKPASSFFSVHNFYLHTIEWSYYKLLGRYFL